VAIFFFNTTSVGRSDGRTAIGAAAYRAGERLRDERTGKLYNYASRQDVLHKEITLPSHFAGDAASWARDRATLWNAAEYAESRGNARVAREYLLALPHELNAQQRVHLTRALSREIADRYGVAVDAAIHAPRAAGDARNFHVHLLATTRELTRTGLGSKAGSELSGRQRFERGLGRYDDELRALRGRTATLVNSELQAAQVAVRVDHRTLAEQGIERESRARLPWGAYRAEARGLRSAIAERVREKYRARVAARTQSAGLQSLEDIRRQARENWLQMRAGATMAAMPETGKSAASGLARQGPDNDHAL
jgi:hypothetical protein